MSFATKSRFIFLGMAILSWGRKGK